MKKDTRRKGPQNSSESAQPTYARLKEATDALRSGCSQPSKERGGLSMAQSTPSLIDGVIQFARGDLLKLAPWEPQRTGKVLSEIFMRKIRELGLTCHPTKHREKLVKVAEVSGEFENMGWAYQCELCGVPLAPTVFRAIEMLKE